MKGILIFLFLTIGVVLSQKSSKYDNVDVDRILQNNRVLTSYIKCMLGEGACTAEGRELKKVLPDSLKNGCSKCDEKQKATAERVMNHLKSKRPADWARLVAKYDPKGEYRTRYEPKENQKN